jgi:hypothetical protein
LWTCEHLISLVSFCLTVWQLNRIV